MANYNDFFDVYSGSWFDWVTYSQRGLHNGEYQRVKNVNITLNDYRVRCVTVVQARKSVHKCAL